MYGEVIDEYILQEIRERILSDEHNYVVWKWLKLTYCESWQSLSVKIRVVCVKMLDDEEMNAQWYVTKIWVDED